MFGTIRVSQGSPPTHSQQLSGCQGSEVTLHFVRKGASCVHEDTGAQHPLHWEGRSARLVRFELDKDLIC